MSYEKFDYDLVIVGAGPAGLSAAIQLKLLDKKNSTNHSVCIVEKGSEVGAHIISGAILEPSSLGELIPDWKNTDIPVKTKVEKESFHFLTKNHNMKIPDFLLPQDMKNEGNFIISLGNLCKWLAKYAEGLGVDIFPGFSAKEIIYDDKNIVKGILTGEKGINKNGEKSDQYEPPIALLGKQTFFAEGCRGHLGKELLKKFNLYKEGNFQTYAIGMKELWEINDNSFPTGSVIHTIGYPLNNKAYGGSFLYKLSDRLASIGFVVGLDYQNPYLSPYQEFQQYKSHNFIKEILCKGNRISYGARALNEGGFQSLPKFTFPGGVLIGCEAGTLNVLKIKGTHTAMKTGIIAAKAFFNNYKEKNASIELEQYNVYFKDSNVYEELYKSRNVRPGFNKGLIGGLINTFFDQKILKGKAPWTLKHKHRDNEILKSKKDSKKIIYPKLDNDITFDRLTNLSFSGTNHKEDQPCHLKVKNRDIPIDYNLKEFSSPETRYCPAGVYEIVEKAININGAISNKPILQINFQNCLHCKTCDIKDPKQNIDWIPPEGGDGPRYSNM